LKDGPLDPQRLFAAVSAMERRPYFGDTNLWRHLNSLAASERPLLKLTGPGPLPLWGEGARDLKEWSVEILPDGRAALDGDLDNVALNGIELSLGGLRLSGRDCLRFDSSRNSFAVK